VASLSDFRALLTPARIRLVVSVGSTLVTALFLGFVAGVLAGLAFYPFEEGEWAGFGAIIFGFLAGSIVALVTYLVMIVRVLRRRFSNISGWTYVMAILGPPVSWYLPLTIDVSSPFSGAFGLFVYTPVRLFLGTAVMLLLVSPRVELKVPAAV
jgi:hypothetical protein